MDNSYKLALYGPTVTNQLDMDNSHKLARYLDSGFYRIKKLIKKG